MRLSPLSLAPALAAILLTACVDDPELATDEQELVGGTATSARPEVGTFFDGVSKGCTATLISPTAVILAAHCLDAAYVDTTVSPGAAFSFTDRNGIPRSVPADRVHTFSTKRFEMLPTGGFTTDISIIHLASAVPTAQAVPAAIATQEAPNGQQVTLFGFGCTDRTPPSGSGGGGGFKQFFTYIYGTGSTALCWGDSGGPAIIGSVNGGGAVWGIHSDFNLGWDVGGLFPDSWTDMFASAAFYKKQIEDLLRAWDGVDELGVDRPGLDYAQDLTASVAACRALCEGDGVCRAFTFVPEAGGGRCWRKSGVPEPVPTATVGVVSGLPRRLEIGMNRWGGDYAGVAVPDAEACSGACGRDHACQAFTFTGGTCWLKNSVPASAPCASCTSGVPRRGLEIGWNRAGFDLATVTTATARLCADQCARHDRCEAYTFTGAASNNCWLKDGVPGATVGTGMTSGVRRGLETNTYRVGTLLRSFWIDQVSPLKCQTECALDSGCTSWSYQPPAGSNGAACFLFSTIGWRAGLTGYVSGVKGLEFLP